MLGKAVSTHQRHPQLSLVAITLIPRIVLLAAAAHRGTPFGAPAHDGYLQIAQNFVAHGLLGLGPHHLLTRGPLYPLLLVPGVFSGHPQVWSALLHLAASVGTCLLVYAAAKSLTGNPRASFWAAVFVTLDPWLIWFAKDPMTTVTATFFVAAALFFFVQVLIGRNRFWAPVGCGLSCGLAALDHPALIVLAAGFTLAILIAIVKPPAHSGISLTLRDAASALFVIWCAFALTLVPYAIRNYRVSGRPVLISDGAGLSYFMGASRYASSPYPWTNVAWDFNDVATRLHVSVADLDPQYFTVNDQLYPELSRQARIDLESLVIHRPVFLAKRSVVMAFWFLAGDYSIARTAAHCVFLTFIFLAILMCWRARGWALTVPFVVILLPGLALHSLTMALIGHAAYSIPYVVPLAMPLALVAARQPAGASKPEPAGDVPGELYALE